MVSGVNGNKLRGKELTMFPVTKCGHLLKKSHKVSLEDYIFSVASLFLVFWPGPLSWRPQSCFISLSLQETELHFLSQKLSSRQTIAKNNLPASETQSFEEEDASHFGCCEWWHRASLNACPRGSLLYHSSPMGGTSERIMEQYLNGVAMM
jgi:hypothetical protein